MDVARLGTDLTSVPTSTLQRGTPLVHYGLTSDSTREAVSDTASGVVAILVCHGMGQQVRYETISSIAEAIRTEATELGGTSAPVQVHLSYDKGAFLARAELQWSDKTKVDHAVHVYEAYWAPLTEGEVTYRDTILFLLSAAWNGLQWSKLFRLSSFERWMFDGRKRMEIGRATFAGIIAVLVFLAMQVALIAFVLLTLAQQYRTLLAMPLPAAGSKNFCAGFIELAGSVVSRLRTAAAAGKPGRLVERCGMSAVVDRGNCRGILRPLFHHSVCGRRGCLHFPVQRQQV